MCPDQPLKCLLVCSGFSRFTYWNAKEVCELSGARAPTSPLGLITAAAILPDQWDFRLMDLNARGLSEADWRWADLVCVGGMYPQQPGTLKIIKRAKREGKFVAVGGPDSTIQPDIYREADALVLGEGEASIPLWLESWRNGVPKGVFRSDALPDMTQSPIPKYDLVNLSDYTQIGLQYSRGCPFLCEFCDVIELLGRVPRTKTPEQFVAELEHLYRLGHRGLIEIVDDNFIGNKRDVKKMLPMLIRWNRSKRYPFSFSITASLNLADDKELLEMMRDANVNYVFVGIETPDPDLLRMTQKRHNAMRPIVERVNTLYKYGIAASAGFIIGFDNEKPGTDEAIIQCIEETAICKIDANMLSALPRTQLTRRLVREGRLLSSKGEPVRSAEEAFRMEMPSFDTDGEDTFIASHLDASLNFVPTRSKAEIVTEYANVIRTIYSPRNYMDRVMRAAKKLRFEFKLIPSWGEIIRSLRAGILLSIKMTRNPTTRYLYWRNVLLCLPLGWERFHYAMSHMALYLHYQKQTELRLKDIYRNWADILKGTQDQEVATHKQIN